MGSNDREDEEEKEAKEVERKRNLTDVLDRIGNEDWSIDESRRKLPRPSLW